jgi:hypothetical protein
VGIWQRLAGADVFEVRQGEARSDVHSVASGAALYEHQPRQVRILLTASAPATRGSRAYPAYDPAGKDAAIVTVVKGMPYTSYGQVTE